MERCVQIGQSEDWDEHLKASKELTSMRVRVSGCRATLAIATLISCNIYLPGVWGGGGGGGAKPLHVTCPVQ